MLARGNRKSLRAVNAVAIAKCDRRHFQFGCDLSQLLGERSATQKTECAGGMELDVGHVGAARFFLVTRHPSLVTSSSVINPIDFPNGVRFVRAHELTVLELHIPLGVRPRFFVPPIPGQQIWPALISDLARDWFALKMSIL